MTDEALRVVSLAERIYREQETGGSSMTVAPKLSKTLKTRTKATIVWAVTHQSP